MFVADFETEQEQYQANQDAGQELYLQGLTDGAMGYRATYSDDDYLKGYCVGLKRLPKHHNGQLIYNSHSTGEPFAFGWYDSERGNSTNSEF